MDATKANLNANKRTLNWKPLWNKVYNLKMLDKVQKQKAIFLTNHFQFCAKKENLELNKHYFRPSQLLTCLMRTQLN